MKKLNVNMPASTDGSGKDAKTPPRTGISGLQNPDPPLAEPPAGRPDHATRFRKGVSGNPKGRPPKVKPEAALNKLTLDSRALLAANAHKLTDRAIQLALKGSPTALRLCLDRIHPAMKDRPVQLNFPSRKSTAHDLLAAHNDLLTSVANGSLTPLEAEAVSKLLEARRRSWESVEMEDRMIQLQDDAQAAKKIGAPPAKIEWVDNPDMPSQAEQDRLDALALEEDDAPNEEALDDEDNPGPRDKDDPTSKDKDNKRQ